MSRIAFTLAISNEQVSPTSSDQLLVSALRGIGHPVDVRPWSDIVPEALGALDVVVVRSVWDYPSRYDAFLGWLAQMKRSRARTLNDPDVMRWNADKSYLVDLQRRGIRVPGSCISGSLALLRSFLARSESAEFIVKPRVGGGGRGVLRLDRNDTLSFLRENQSRLEGLILQEFCPEVLSGELSFVFFGHAFCHCVRRKPGSGDFRANRSFGSTSEAVDPPAALIEAASTALSRAPSSTTYARVDGFVGDKGFICSELELIDPALFLDFDGRAPAAFAEACLASCSDLADPRPRGGPASEVRPGG